MKNNTDKLKFALDRVLYIEHRYCHDFLSMQDNFHMDEIWFYIMKDKKRTISFHLQTHIA